MDIMNEIEKLNSAAWDEEKKKNNWWTRPVSREETDRARHGDFQIGITPVRKMPEEWMEKIKGKVLALASGGGQQGPLLAAAGYDVTVADVSSEQLAQDRMAAERDSLAIRTVKTSMSDLSVFGDDEFDTVICPVSINFVEDCRTVFRQVSRVLRKDGFFMFGIANPVMYIFDVGRLEKGRMKIKYTLPFSALHSLSAHEREKLEREKGTFEFSHTLDSIIGGLCGEGFMIDAFYSDTSGFEPVDSYIQDCYLAFSAVNAKV